jgi:hypothetical protein
MRCEDLDEGAHDVQRTLGHAVPRRRFRRVVRGRDERVEDIDEQGALIADGHDAAGADTCSLRDLANRRSAEAVDQEQLPRRANHALPCLGPVVITCHGDTPFLTEHVQ